MGRRLTTMSVMPVTVREFTRKFPNFRRAALAGQEVRVRDRAGNNFVFRATETKAVTLAEAMGDRSWARSVAANLRRHSAITVVIEAILDTGPLVGSLDRDDQWHHWAVERFATIQRPALTCEAVISGSMLPFA